METFDIESMELSHPSFKKSLRLIRAIKKNNDFELIERCDLLNCSGTPKIL